MEVTVDSCLASHFCQGDRRSLAPAALSKPIKIQRRRPMSHLDPILRVAAVVIAIIMMSAILHRSQATADLSVSESSSDKLKLRDAGGSRRYSTSESRPLVTCHLSLAR